MKLFTAGAPTGSGADTIHRLYTVTGISIDDIRRANIGNPDLPPGDIDPLKAGAKIYLPDNAVIPSYAPPASAPFLEVPTDGKTTMSDLFNKGWDVAALFSVNPMFAVSNGGDIIPGAAYNLPYPTSSGAFLLLGTITDAPDMTYLAPVIPITSAQTAVTPASGESIWQKPMTYLILLGAAGALYLLTRKKKGQAHA